MCFTQIKYASEDGFKSIISLTYYPDSDTHRGVDYPSSDESQTLSTTLVDIPYSTVPPEGSIVEDLVEFAEIYDDVKEALDNAEKPGMSKKNCSHECCFRSIPRNPFFSFSFRRDKILIKISSYFNVFDVDKLHL